MSSSVFPFLFVSKNKENNLEKLLHGVVIATTANDH